MELATLKEWKMKMKKIEVEKGEVGGGEDGNWNLKTDTSRVGF